MLKFRTKSAIAVLVGALFCLPVILGLAGIILPAFGYFPALGHTNFTLDIAISFLATPGLAPAIWLSLKTGLLATGLSLIGSFILIVCFFGTALIRYLRNLMGPLVAIPHSTIAIGMLFLLTPSGWLLRLISPELSGFERPPAWDLLPDDYGLGLILGLMAKEVPFLVMLGMAGSATIPVARLQDITTNLGYGKLAGWVLIILPLVYRQLRLPVIAVLIFSISVVDMALLLAPSLPPPLAILVLNDFNDADLASRLPASFGALLQILLAIIGVCIWLILEGLIGSLLQHCQKLGFRATAADKTIPFFVLLASLPMIIGVFGLVAAFIWSFSESWFFPAALPSIFSLTHWHAAVGISSMVLKSAMLAITSSLLATCIILTLLYIDRKNVVGNAITSEVSDLPKKLLTAALFLPLLIPQISFLFGLQIGLSWAGFDGSWPALLYCHMIFIMPYAWLILSPAFVALEWKHDYVAATLGLGPISRFFRIHLALLAFPIGAALFIGVSVSIALYLPTVFVGGGRINTITVEAVSLGASGGRGPAGVAAMIQILIPLICFLVIQASLRLRFGRFSSMRSGGLQ